MARWIDESLIDLENTSVDVERLNAFLRKMQARRESLLDRFRKFRRRVVEAARLRGHQFQLRTLLLAVALFGGVLLPARAYLIKQNDLAVANDGWVIEFLRDAPEEAWTRPLTPRDHARAYSFCDRTLHCTQGRSRRQVSLSTLAEFAQRHGVEDLHLPPQDYRHLTSLLQLSSLKRLNLEHRLVTYGDMEVVSQLPALESLQLGRARWRSLDALQHAPQLQSLSMGGNASPLVLQSLPHLRQLSVLTLRYEQIPPCDHVRQQMEWVAQCRSLQVLNILGQVDLIGDELALLGSCSQLRTIRLRTAGFITEDACLAAAEIRSLRRLDCGEASVPLSRIRGKRPDLEVTAQPVHVGCCIF